MDWIAGRLAAATSRPARGKVAVRTLACMWDVYWVGVFLGLGVGIGVVLAGLLGTARFGPAAAIVVGAVTGIGLGLALGGLEDGIAGGLGGLLGAVSIHQLVSGTLRRGGTRGAAAALVAVAGILFAVLAFVPLVGFLEAVALPALGARMRRREPSRFAGLRTLARD
jgi:hypothetical protein